MHSISVKDQAKIQNSDTTEDATQMAQRGIKGCSMQLCTRDQSKQPLGDMTTQPWKGQKQLERSVITGGHVNGSDHFGTSFDVIC